MKIAVSIPDDIFHEAERLARRTKRSRSRLFSDALREYVTSRTPEKLTRQMNLALAEIGDKSDELTSSAARKILEQVEW